MKKVMLSSTLYRKYARSCDMYRGRDEPVLTTWSISRCVITSPYVLIYFFHYESTCMGDAEAHGVGSTGTDDTARTGRVGVCGDYGSAAGEIFCVESGGVDARR